jgi:DNA primase
MNRFQIYKEAARFYRDTLLYDNSGRVGFDYLLNRKINTNSIVDFFIGFAESTGDELYSYLSRRFNTYDIMASGLFIVNYPEVTPVFKDRIVFPIIKNNEVVSFSTRSIHPESKIPHKHLAGALNCVYNYNVLKASSQLFVTESPIDAISLKQMGYNAVAVFGVANIDSSKIIAMASAQKIYIVFDNDNKDDGTNPGYNAALKHGLAIKYLTNKKVFIVTLPLNGNKKMDVNKLLCSSDNPNGEFHSAVYTSLDIECTDGYEEYVNNQKKEKKELRTRRKTLDELKQIPLLEVLERYGIEAYDNGGKSIVAKCPFHADANPSFIIYVDTNTFKCWGCNERGDTIDFVKLMEGVSFTQACRLLKEDLYGR